MKFFRIILFPFSLVYLVITGIRNWLYDKKVLKSFQLDIKTISVGNLTVGGTGKTPVVEYLVRLLKDKYHLVVLSRGYKRKTHGLYLAGVHDAATTIGDEPKQLITKFGEEIGVSVCEDRLYAIPHILKSKPDTDLILLDDAFQHRSIISSCNILLSDFNRPFYKDWYLPSGNLRESKKSARRADAVIITKCPSNLTEYSHNTIRIFLNKFIRKDVPVFFMKIQYLDPVPAFNKNLKITDRLILVTGIAQPKPLADYVRQKYQLIKHFSFPDHHYFTRNDIKKIRKYLDKNGLNGISILFTEKDINRFLNTDLQDILMNYPVFFQPITYKFVHNGSEFNEFIQKVLANTGK